MMAIKAIATARRPAQCDMVANSHARDILTNRFDQARAFVPGDDGHWFWRRADRHAPVAAADAAGRNLDQDFAGFRWVQRHGFHAKRCICSRQDSGLHLHRYITFDSPSVNN